MQTTRREVLGQAANGLVLARVARGLAWLSPAAAAACSAEWRSLTAVEARWLEGLATAIAPPVKGTGFSHFIDHHVSVPAAKSLLAVRYLDIAPPYLTFYRAGVAALVELAGSNLPPPDDMRWSALLTDLAAGGGSGWKGPPAPLFLFAVRLDAIDVAYGTRAGFARLGVDYLAHVV